MRVLGIDPGLTRCGLGVVDGLPGRQPRLIAFDVLRTPAELDTANRLVAIEETVDAWITQHRPTAVAIERVFAQHNVQTVMGTAQAAGRHAGRRPEGGCGQPPPRVRSSGVTVRSGAKEQRSDVARIPAGEVPPSGRRGRRAGLAICQSARRDDRETGRAMAAAADQSARQRGSQPAKRL